MYIKKRNKVSQYNYLNQITSHLKACSFSLTWFSRKWATPRVFSVPENSSFLRSKALGDHARVFQEVNQNGRNDSRRRNLPAPDLSWRISFVRHAEMENKSTMEQYY